jgi:thioredoxin 2
VENDFMAIVTCPNCGAKNRVDESRASDKIAICGKCKHELPSSTAGGKPIVVTDQNFASTLTDAGDKPLLVDCWAAWCGPCRMLAPIVEELAAESNGRYVIAKLNTDENPQTAGKFNISAIPTMLIFKNGKKIDQLVGLQPKSAILARLAQLV